MHSAARGTGKPPSELPAGNGGPSSVNPKCGERPCGAGGKPRGDFGANGDQCRRRKIEEQCITRQLQLVPDKVAGNAAPSPEIGRVRLDR